MLTRLEHGERVAGIKQTRRALRDGRAKVVFLARDADPALTQPLALLAQEAGVPVQWADAMGELAVGAAVAALI